MSFKPTNKSKSLSSLREGSFHDYRRHSASASESSVEVYVADFETNSCDGDAEAEGKQDSGLGDETLGALEVKIDNLNDLYAEQCRLLTDIKEEMRCSREGASAEGPPPGHSLVMDLLLKALELNSSQLPASPEGEEGDWCNVRARSLLDALQATRGDNLDREFAQALVEFLQSEEVRQCVVSGAVEGVREAVATAVSQDVARVYLPALERCHRRLARRVTSVLEDAFAQLQEHAANYRPSSFHATTEWVCRHLARQRCQRHRYHSMMRDTVQRVLEKELQQWRNRALEVFFFEADQAEEEEIMPPAAPAPPSPSQPADPQSSLIDQLMMTAEINKQIQDGDINGSFERALSASDLSLVMAACRAVDPVLVFAPICQLQPHVLLSLLQQLATDMVHDTQLKCRYLEEALISLNSARAPATRAHLPLVIGDVRKHLTDFLAKYPSHVASRRVTLIVMAADNLLK